MNLGACPTCGYELGVYQNVRVVGRAEVLWGAWLERIPGLWNRRDKGMPHSDAVRCNRCHHIRRDWQAIDGELVRGE